jgi:hypothetical protein
LVHRSPLNGTPQVVQTPGERWVASLVLPPVGIRRDRARARAAFLNRITLGGVLVAVPMFDRPLPLGTLRGAPTLASAVARHGNAFTFSGATPGATWLAGDCFGLGGQVFEAAEAATVGGGGQITINTTNRARVAIASGTLLWSYPRVTMLCPAAEAGLGYEPGWQQAVAVDLEEHWVPA